MTATDDPRLGRWLRREGEPPEALRAVIVGFPSDEGVRRNGGRPGAREGPDRIREALYALTPDASPAHREDFLSLLERTRDAGDVEVTGEVEEDQRRLGRRLAPYLREGAFPVVLGGGHETAFGHFLGYVEAGLSPAILNWDAHPDVREWAERGPHSGSPFRQALLHPSGACRGYEVAGLARHSAAAPHLDFLRERGGRWTWAPDVDVEAVTALYADRARPTLVSFDLDAVDGAYAPGVSAPATDGLRPAVWLAAAEEAGRRPAVTSADVVEMNPRFDRDGRTARLAALTVWRILRGLAARG